MTGIANSHSKDLIYFSIPLTEILDSLTLYWLFSLHFSLMMFLRGISWSPNVENDYLLIPNGEEIITEFTFVPVSSFDSSSSESAATAKQFDYFVGTSVYHDTLNKHTS